MGNNRLHIHIHQVNHRHAGAQKLEVLLAVMIAFALAFCALAPTRVSARGASLPLAASNPVWVQKTSPAAPGAIAGLQVKAGDPLRLSAVVSGSSNMYSSSNGGATWTPTASEGLQPFLALAESRTTASDFFALDAASRVYRSTDSGATWLPLSLVGVAASDIDTGSDAAGLVAATGATGVDKPMYYSADGGFNWIPGVGPATAWSLAAGDPTAADVFYATRKDAGTTPVARSLDGGATWADCASLPESIHASALAVIPHSGPLLVGSDTPGTGQVYRSNDRGDTWTASATGLPAGERVLAISVNPTASAIAYATTDKSVYASYDGGTTWSSISANLPQKEYRSVSAAGDATNAIYVGAADGTVYETSCPVITKVQPASGKADDIVTITGLNLGTGGAGSYVSFAGVQATSYVLWSDTHIVVRVPADALSGNLFVVTPLGSTNALLFTINTPAPPSYHWYLAEGCTGKDSRGAFETWVLVQNPGTVTASVKLTFMTDGGQKAGPTISVPPGSRQSVSVADYVPNTWSVSTMLTCDEPVIAERSVYWNAVGCYRQAATDSIGVTEPQPSWYLAEGCTGERADGSFETWVLVQNPGTEPASVHLTYMTPGGPVSGPYLTLPPGYRQSVNVAETLPNCWSVSTSVASDRPVVAERSMYLDTPTVYRQAATDSIGAAAGSANWYLAEGCTGTNGSGSFETWVLVQNPGAVPADITITYMTTSGPVDGPKLTLAPMSRQSVNVADIAPGVWDISTTVTATRPVIAERAIYWNDMKHKRESATDSIGVTAPAKNWCLAEGSTGGNAQGSFETWVLVQNPGVSVAIAHLTYMTPNGPVEGPTLTLEPNTRQTVNVAETLPTAWDVSTRVVSDQPVVVERSVYWNAPGVLRQAADDSIGVPQ